MQIKKMFATFGKLRNAELSLAKGLNIVYGSNESGKSTWSAFIKAMLYGVSTKERSAAGSLADKEKYLPWSGEAMYGRMELTQNGEEAVIERTAGRGGVLAKCDARFVKSGAELPVGAELLGVEKSAYERTAFIGQAKLRVDHDADMEKKLSAIASEGFDEVAASEVLKRLENKKRRIRAARGNAGRLSEVESELLGIKEEEAFISGISEKIEEISGELSASGAALAEISRKCRIKEAFEAREKAEYKKRAAAELEAAEKQLSELSDMPTRTEVFALSEAVADYEKEKAEVERQELLVKASESELCRFKEAAERNLAFGKMTESEARAAAERDKQSLEAKKGAKKPIVPIILGVLGVVFLVGAIFAPVLAAIGAVLLLAAVILAAKKGKKEENDGLLQKYGAASPDAIEAALGEYLSALSQAIDAERLLALQSEAQSKASVRAEDRKKKAQELCARLKLNAESFEAAISEANEKALSREAAERRKKEAQIRAEALLGAAENEAEEEFDEAEVPEEELASLLEEKQRCDAKCRELEIALATLRAKAEGKSLETLKEREAVLSEEKEALSFEYDAIELAEQMIAEADSELRGRFAPEVGRRAAEIFRELTGGRFESVRIENAKFDMKVSETASSAPREILMLSQGTLDELYFSLRLALCEAVLGDSSAPVILDDALVNFDNERMSRALDILKEYAEHRQVILFTCHERESEYFKDDSSVSCIAL